MPIKKVPFSLPPLNSTSSGFSPTAGYPVIKFSIPSQNAQLETSSLRLVGRIQMRSTSTQVINPTVVNYTDIQEGPASGTFEECTALTIPAFGGVQCSIDKIILQSKKTQAELSTVLNYSQYISLRTSRMGTVEDFRNSLPSRSLSLGENAANSQARYNISDSSASDEEQGQEFSIKLDVDLLQNNILDLSDANLGGLLLTIYLNPESAFLSTFQNGTITPQTTSIANYRYILQQVRLEGRYILPTQAEVKAYNPNLIMDNQINLLQDVYSSRSVNTVSPQAAVVKGIVSLFLLQSQTNNLNQSQFNYLMPQGLKTVNQNKNNMRYPLKFPIQPTPNYGTVGAVNFTSIYYKSLQTGIAEARMYLERAVNDGFLPSYTSATMVLSERAQRNVRLASSSATNSNNLDVDSIGIGNDYTFGFGQAQNFKNQDYSLSLDSGTATGNALLPATYRDSALLQQIFVRNTAFFSTQTLVKTM